MIAVIKGDISSTRLLSNQEIWLKPLQALLSTWGKSPKNWELVWGDFFQLEVENPNEVVCKALKIKALIKNISALEKSKKSSPVDVRMAIGIGQKTYNGKKISESNGPAFVFAGEKFDLLKKENTKLAIKSPWNTLDNELNLYLKLGAIFMDKWTTSSAELVQLVLNSPQITQEELGKKLNIKQSAVSGRWNRAYLSETLEIEKVCNTKIAQQLAL